MSDAARNGRGAEKACSKCGVSHPATTEFFVFRRACWDQPCRPCRREAERQRWQRRAEAERQRIAAERQRIAAEDAAVAHERLAGFLRSDDGLCQGEVVDDRCRCPVVAGPHARWCDYHAPKFLRVPRDPADERALAHDVWRRVAPAFESDVEGIFAFALEVDAAYERFKRARGIVTMASLDGVTKTVYLPGFGPPVRVRGGR